MRSTYNLNLVPKHILNLLLESPCLIIASPGSVHELLIIPLFAHVYPDLFKIIQDSW